MSNQTLFEQANQVIPGGVNSPVRAFKSVGGDPVFINKAEGSRVYDEDGKAYIDYVGSWGPMILGHAHPDVVKAVQDQASRGLSFGAPTVIETEMAALINQRMPWIEKVRMVNSGTEATMSAIRLARGYTGRDKIVKFEGCYHGHADSLLVKAGSGALTFGVPTSPGVPADTVKHTLTAEYNNLDSVSAIFEQVGPEIAAIIIEPVAGNMNCIPPADGFLQGLRDICDEAGSLLIMDEVMTGFRVSRQGAQGRFGVIGDITALGKIVGGGMPVGAFGGSAEIMAHLAPEGGVYQAGTLSGNPIAMAAGLATLKSLDSEALYAALTQKTETLLEGICQAGSEAGIPVTSNQVGPMFGLFLLISQRLATSQTLAPAMASSLINSSTVCWKREFIWRPRLLKRALCPAAHSEEDIADTIAAARTVLAAM